ncbi:MAG: hypothetical protein ACUZ8H_07050 [Candidatus Anammoxibacter sp.]
MCLYHQKSIRFIFPFKYNRVAVNKTGLTFPPDPHELNEKGRLAGTVLSFVISKCPEHNDIKINEIKTIDSFFKNYPDLNVEEVKNTLPDYLEIKNNLDSIKTKSETIEDRILYRSNSPWVLILPKQTSY